MAKALQFRFANNVESEENKESLYHTGPPTGSVEFIS